MKEINKKLEYLNEEINEDFDDYYDYSNNFRYYINLLNLYKHKINYKNIKLLEQFITEDGKIKSRAQTFIRVKFHKLIAKAIKKARMLKLIPFNKLIIVN